MVPKPQMAKTAEFPSPASWSTGYGGWHTQHLKSLPKELDWGCRSHLTSLSMQGDSQCPASCCYLLPQGGSILCQNTNHSQSPLLAHPTLTLMETHNAIPPIATLNPECAPFKQNHSNPSKSEPFKQHPTPRREEAEGTARFSCWKQLFMSHTNLSQACGCYELGKQD